jgi:hypothetical protein
MSAQLVFRRNFAGRLVAAVEYDVIRSSKYDRPAERYTLSEEQEHLPIDVLTELVAANKLTKWAAPPPLTKTVKAQNSEMAKASDKV